MIFTFSITILSSKVGAHFRQSINMGTCTLMSNPCMEISSKKKETYHSELLAAAAACQSVWSSLSFSLVSFNSNTWSLYHCQMLILVHAWVCIFELQVNFYQITRYWGRLRLLTKKEELCLWGHQSWVPSNCLVQSFFFFFFFFRVQSQVQISELLTSSVCSWRAADTLVASPYYDSSSMIKI
jgi:hypothetical protein